MKIRKALILAAGEGRRLWPLTETVPKPLVRVGDGTIIGNIISYVESKGIVPYIVVRPDHLSLFRQHLGDKNFIVRKEGKGTAASVKMAKGFEEPFLVLSGDHVMDYSIISDIVDCWGGENTIAVRYSKEAYRFGVISSYCGKVVAVKEKPKDIREGFINMGMYVVLPSLLPKLETLKPSPRGELEFTDLLEGFSIFSTVKPWMDVASPWNLLDAFNYLHEGQTIVKGDVHPSAQLTPPCYVAEGAVVGEGASISSSYIGPGCRISKGAVVENCYLQGKNDIGEGTVIRLSFLGEGASIGSGKNVLPSYYETIDLNGKEVRAERELGAFLPPGARM